MLESALFNDTCTYKLKALMPYLCFLTLRALGLAAEALRTLGLTETVLKLLDALAGLRSFRGEGFACWARREAMCFSSSSPIVALRRATGIRLTRLSIRARRSFAWRAYCARSLRARSVTMAWLVDCQVSDVSRERTFELQVVNQGLLLSAGNTKLLPRRAVRRCPCFVIVGRVFGRLAFSRE